MFSFLKKDKEPFAQTDTATWQDQWRSLVPPECRNVPVEVDGVSIEAYVLVNHFAMMLQDGLLMEASFFDVCEHFQKAGYHVIWLMRCTQDIHNGYLKQGAEKDGVTHWLWKQPTTNFGRWISDNHDASILIQYAELPEGDLAASDAPVLARVTWATSDDDEKMVPDRTEFQTAPLPATPKQVLRWLNGAALRELKE